MSLLVGIAILALAVALGGLAAYFRERGRHLMSAIRTFAVVAAASVALLHLLPEAIAAIGSGALVATAIGIFGPAALERAIPSQHDHQHESPTTALAMGYAAVVAHQAGEGAALASLAQTGALKIAIVLAIAAHTVPLAMVVAIRVLEVSGGKRATGLALAGVAFATVAGAVAGSFVGTARLAAVQPWLLALVAGLLLHALSHDVLAPPSRRLAIKIGDTAAGWAGLSLAIFGVEDGGWLESVPWGVRVAGVAVLAGLIAGRSFLPQQDDGEGHAHRGHRH